jgi:hypothetical protein
MRYATMKPVGIAVVYVVVSVGTGWYKSQLNVGNGRFIGAAYECQSLSVWSSVWATSQQFVL